MKQLKLSKKEDH